MATATIRDVAQRAGVGVATVSRVINGSPSVSETTRRKVLAAVEALDYSPNVTARRLSLGRTSSVGVIVPFFTNASVVERLRGIDAVLADSGYDLILFNVETTKRRDFFFRDVPRRERVDGVLIISLLLDDLDGERFIQAQIPTVLIDAIHPHFSWVKVDDISGGYRATKHLTDLGHRKIAFINDHPDNPFNFTPQLDRFQGYRRALEVAQIPFREEYYCEGALGRLQAKRLAEKLLMLPDPPTAIFAYSDTQAIGVLEAAAALNINIPSSLSVIGFDNIEAAEYLHLSTVDQSLYQSGLKGGQLLLDLIADPTRTVQQISLSTKLVIRQTTAPPGVN